MKTRLTNASARNENAYRRRADRRPTCFHTRFSSLQIVRHLAAIFLEL